MQRPLPLAGLVVAVALALAGCDADPPAPVPTLPGTTVTPSAAATTGAPDPTAAATTAAASPTPSGPVMTVDGSGVYLLGTVFATLQSGGKVADVHTGAEVCGANTTARGIGAYTDIRMSSRPDGKIYLVVDRTPSIPTPSGAKVNMTPAQIQGIYGGSAQMLTNGSAKAILVAPGARGLLFDLDIGNTKVISIIAGDAAYLKSSFLSGSDWC